MWGVSSIFHHQPPIKFLGPVWGWESQSLLLGVVFHSATLLGRQGGHTSSTVACQPTQCLGMLGECLIHQWKPSHSGLLSLTWSHGWWFWCPGCCWSCSSWCHHQLKSALHSWGSRKWTGETGPWVCCPVGGWLSGSPHSDALRACLYSLHRREGVAHLVWVCVMGKKPLLILIHQEN